MKQQQTIAFDAAHDALKKMRAECMMGNFEDVARPLA